MCDECILQATLITLVETRHSAGRRLVKSRAQTHQLVLDRLHGDLACRQHPRQHQRYHYYIAHSLKPRQVKAKRTAKQKQDGVK